MPDPDDRRAKLIRPTDTARPLVETIETLARRVRRQAMGAMGERQSEIIRGGLERMRDALAADAAGEAS